MDGHDGVRGLGRGGTGGVLGTVAGSEDDEEGPEAAAAAEEAREVGGAHLHLAPAELLGVEREDRREEVLVDPPREGAIALVNALPDAWPRRIVYVSCDPPTLARDVRKLLDAGYRLTGIDAFDLFPNTAHVEAVVTLER